jgi:CheY-like chemotaxis protein
MSNQAREEKTKPEQYRVLVVEDNSPDSVLIGEALSEAGLNCQITEMRDGDEALELVLQTTGSERAPYDLLIMDLNMPRVGGMEVLSRIRAVPAWKDTGILVLTSSLSPQEKEEAKALGADEYVRKAADLFEFLTSVGEAAGRLLRRASTS